MSKKNIKIMNKAIWNHSEKKKHASSQSNLEIIDRKEKRDEWERERERERLEVLL